MWLKSCRLESCCWENNCPDRCLILVHFGGVFGSCGLDLECDGASIGHDDDFQKTGYQSDTCNSCSSLAVLLKQVNLKASKKPENSVTSITLVATMASMASMVASMASMVSTEMWASIESKETPMASLASVRMALASLDWVATMVWATYLSGRIL